MLLCENLSVMRGGRALLAGVSFEVPAGGCLRLLGANGSGKTTLLRTLAGLTPVAAGKLFWDKKIVPNYQDVQHFVGHAPGVAESLTVSENLALWARLHGMEEALPAALLYFGLAPYAELRADKLSAGFKRKLALARLMVLRAPLWLLDEPMSHLDAASQTRVSELLAAHLRQGGLAVTASHGEQAEIPGAPTLDVEIFRAEAADACQAEAVHA